MKGSAEVPPSLNIEYFLLRGQDFFLGFDFVSWPSWVAVFVQSILIIGMVLSILFIILIVYALIRLHQVEHEGFHALEAHAHEHHEEAHAEADTAHGNERWEHIVALATGPSGGDWRRAILEADIMLYEVLDEQGYPGATVGEKLKMANPIQMTTLDLAWKAHKVRNDVAHQGEQYPLTERDVKATIDYYKRVFEEFGAI